MATKRRGDQAGGRLRVVVMGATGNVGSKLVRALHAEPAVGSVVGVARRLPEEGFSPETEWVRADIAVDPLEPVVDGADVVVHVAWLIQPARRLDALWGTNVVGTRRLLDAVANSGVGAVVYSSSVGAYSPGPKDRAVDESWPTDGVPELSYSREKAYVERMLDIFERDHDDIRVVRLRPGLLFQAEAASEIRRLFIGPLFPDRVARPALVKLVQQAPTRFQALHTDDAADAFRRAVVRDVRGPFNLAADPVLGRSWGPAALEKAVVAAAGAGWRLHLDPLDPAWVRLAFAAPVMDASRAREELDWITERSSLDVAGRAVRRSTAGDGRRH